jgi:Protein of unknown function (DUF5132)
LGAVLERKELYMDDFIEFIPGGAWTVAAVGLLSVPAVRKQVRPAAKFAVRAGLVVVDGLKGFVAEAREQAEDLVAEVRAEREGDGGVSPAASQAGSQPQPARARRTRTEPATG